MTNQVFAHIENKAAETESTMTFKAGVSGNPHGNRHRTRHLLNQEFMQALLLHFRQHGKNMLAAQAGEAAKVIEGTAEPAALPAPEASIGAGLEPKRQRRPNRLMMQADTAVGPRERTPRKRKVPSPPAA
jgi:hypothetical protein